jgi:hypothetical protein
LIERTPSADREGAGFPEEFTLCPAFFLGDAIGLPEELGWDREGENLRRTQCDLHGDVLLSNEEGFFARRATEDENTTARDPAMREKVGLNEAGAQLWGLVVRRGSRKRDGGGGGGSR